MQQRSRRAWNAERVKQLRDRLQLTQAQLASQLGVRQQTISEWETGVYAPRGASARLLDVVAERVDREYGGDASPSNASGQTE